MRCIGNGEKTMSASKEWELVDSKILRQRLYHYNKKTAMTSRVNTLPVVDPTEVN